MSAEALPFVILTRPLSQSVVLAKSLATSACVPLVLPALAFTSKYVELTYPLSDYDLVMCVSGQALRFFVSQQLSDNPSFVWPKQTAIAAVGPATLRVMQDFPTVFCHNLTVFYPTHTDDGFFDSEALWTVLKDQLPNFKKVLIVRASQGRDWLAQRLQASVETDIAEVYERTECSWTDLQSQCLTLAAQQNRDAIWLLTSKQSLDALFKQWQAHDLLSWVRQQCFVVIHPRIASYLGQKLLNQSGIISSSATIEKITVCMPQEDAIIRTIRSLL